MNAHFFNTELSHLWRFKVNNTLQHYAHVASTLVHAPSIKQLVQVVLVAPKQCALVEHENVLRNCFCCVTRYTWNIKNAPRERPENKTPQNGSQIVTMVHVCHGLLCSDDQVGNCNVFHQIHVHRALALLNLRAHIQY